MPDHRVISLTAVQPSSLSARFAVGGNGRSERLSGNSAPAVALQRGTPKTCSSSGNDGHEHPASVLHEA